MMSLVESDAEGREVRREGVGSLADRGGDARPSAASDIAIIGMSGIFPGAHDLETFWENLQAGRSFFERFSKKRGRTGTDDASRDAGGDDWWGAFLDEVADFDADFFSVSPREAARMDPQQRLFLKVAWKAFEDAGYRPSAIAGASVGVFVGVGANEYLELGRRLGAATGELNLIELYPNLLPNRVSNFLNLCGPSELIDTACSSSLVAIHRASMSLASGECAVALAGGVNLLLTPDRFRAMNSAGMLSPDGSCRVFDSRVNGIVRGEGVGAVLLKPLRRAVADGDSVYAVIKGSAANHSGRTGSLLASNPVAQLEVIRQAFRRAGVDAATVSYAEAQGSGTESGDALEVRVLQEAWGRPTQAADAAGEQQQRCRIGTLKPNVGHLEAAAGVAAVIKTALALKHGRVPRVAQLEEVNPTVNLGTRFEISAETADWQPSIDADGRPLPRRASVNVFAYGGTNAHIVLEDYAAPPAEGTEAATTGATAQILPFSARDEERLRETARDFHAFLERRGDALPPLADIAYTLQTGRVEMRCRLAIVAATTAELGERLAMFLAGTPAVEHTLYAELAERGEALESFGPDAEDKSYLRALWEQGKLRKIAALWVHGATIQWSELPRGGARRRVSLPGYSFARTRFWWPTTEERSAEFGSEHVSREVKTAPANQKEMTRTSDAAAFVREQLGRVLGLSAATLMDAADALAEKSLRSLGFDSLLAMELRSRIRQERGADVPLKTLLDAETVAQLVGGLAPLLEAARGEEGETRDEGEVTFVAEPSRRFEPFPLTDIQMAYLLGRNDYATLGGNGCHLYWEFENAAGWDVERLNRAWDRLVGRHEMLRAVFLADNRQQTLNEVPPYRFEVHDLRAESEKEARRRLDRVREEMSHERFAAERWPLFRVAVSMLPGAMRLHFSIDLLLVDAMSMFLLLEQWAQFYDEPERAAEPPALAFRDYVLHLEKLKTTPAYRRATEHWNRACESLPPAPELPQTIEPQALRRPRFRRHARRFDAATWAALQEHARRRGLTPNVVLLAAYAEVLARWSRRQQFTLNLTVANRLPVAAGVVDVVGDFTSTVLVAVEHDGAASFTARAAALGDRLAADLDHCLVSGVQVLRELARKRREPVLMPVVFTSMLGYSASLKQRLSLDTLGALVYGVTQTPQVTLDCQVREEGGALEVCWDAVEELYPPRLVEEMFASFAGLIERLSHADDCWHESRPELLPAAQRARRDAANDTATPRRPELLHAGFLEQARRRSDETALVAPGCRFTYGELYEHARDIAARLRAHGAQPNELIALVMHKGWEQVAGALGVLMSGAAYLPVDATLPPARVRQLLSIGEVRVVLTQREVEASLGWPEGVRRVVVEKEATRDTNSATKEESIVGFENNKESVVGFENNGDDFFSFENPARASDLAYVIFTSGSTGVPKGVMISHEAAANTVRDINERFGVGERDRVLALSAMSFDLSVYDVFGLLAAGGAVVMPEPDSLRDPQHLAALVARERVTVWNSVPSYLQLLTDSAAAHDAGRLDTLRLVMLSGDWIPLGLVPKSRALCPRARLVSLGGATEASIWSIFYEIESVDPAWKSVPYGKPLANQTFRVLDKHMDDCPDWVAGDLYIGGEGLALGYWRDEEKTRERFVTHPVSGERLYLTGDVGRYRSDGNIEFLGREDSQVKVGGYRVELGEVEAALAACAGVEDAAVVAFTNDAGVRQLAAFYTNAHGAVADSKELRGQLKTRLPNYMLPASWRRLDAMPLTTNGKLDRRALEKLATANKTPRTITVDAKTPHVVADDKTPRVVAVDESTLRVSARAPEEDVLARLLSEPSVLREPGARQKFVRELKGVRADLGGAFRLALNGAEPPSLNEEYRRRRSSRSFNGRKLDRHSLAALLGRLRGVASGERVKYLFPSAGNAYGVQTYVAVKPGRFENLSAGVYYYHPLRHELQRTSDVDPLSAGLHAPTNHRLFAESGFSIFFIADARAVEPLYGNLALDFARLEAGYMGQTLVEAADACGLGLCPIGYLDFAPVRAHFRLDDSHQLLHSFVGGAPVEDDKDETLTNAESTFAASSHNQVEDRPKTTETPGTATLIKHNGDPDPSSHAYADSQLKLIEDDIADIWAEALQGERPGADESFFETGGDSFTAVAVQQRLAERFPVPLSVTDLFRYPTVRALARYVHTAAAHDAPPSPETLEKTAPETSTPQTSDSETRGDVRRAVRSRIASRREQGGGV